ncbi:MAG: hypothetical protein A3H27_18570 [Acidobacteria bacterium RIFCSPLOWO2_02_FULL_59_13]|nr:MAG: hypothetical protein A3H27_18570 [Acidobacteria bacterium RIFCSPLOWO2_02_FULL_59_13]
MEPTNKKAEVRSQKSRARRTRESGVRGAAQVPLYPYQERWVRDGSRFKLAVKATQIGYSFAAALEAVRDCIRHRTLWIVLSRGERQSLEFMQKARELAQALRIVGSKLETSFFEKTNILQHEVKFPNGSRIIGVPANPDTARGYTGNMILDEFAFHQHDREIWAAAFGRMSRGELKLRVISTPNGQRGKFYELAKEAGLVDVGVRSQESEVRSQKEKQILRFAQDYSRSSDFFATGSNNHPTSIWSGHWCDVHLAKRLGCPINAVQLRQALGDEESWQQEYECVFLSDSQNYIPMELIVESEHEQATTALPLDWRADGGRECYFGYDVGRVRDLAVVAVVEKVGDVYWTRALIEMPKTKFSAQEQVIGDVAPLCVRGAVDATGLGMEMAERLAQKFPGRVEPVSFTLARKQDLAMRLKQQFEERRLRIPESRELRRDLNAVKREVTSAGNVRFDAERTEQGHADRFWALALALHAAGSGASAASGEIESERESYDAERGGSIYEAEKEPWAETVGGMQ